MNGKLDFERELEILCIIYDIQMKKINQITNMIGKLKNNNQNQLIRLGEKKMKDLNIKIKSGDYKL